MARYDAPIWISSRNVIVASGQFSAFGAAPVWTMPASPLAINEGASIDMRSICASTFVMLFSVDPSGTPLLGTALSLSPSGPLTAAALGPPGLISGIRIIANDQHGGITVSPTFSVNVLAPAGAPLVINIAPFSVVFIPGVAGQTVNLAQYVSTTGGPIPTPTLHYSLLDSMSGISLVGSTLVYDPLVLTGNTDLDLSVTDQNYAVAEADVPLFAINDSTADGATAGASHPFAKLWWVSTAVTYPQSLYQYTYRSIGSGYGDCVGSDGAAYPGSQAFFARVTQAVLPTNQALSIPATSLVNFWINGNKNWGITLIGSAGAISNFADRTNATVANRPTLNIVRSDSTTVALPCLANRSLTAPSGALTGAIIDCTAGVGSMLLTFDVSSLLLPVQSATLSLFGAARGTSNIISMYATDLSYVLRLQAPVPGLAAASVQDASLIATYNADLAIASGASPPATPAGGVLYTETWPDIVNMTARNYYSRSSSGNPASPNLSLITGSTDAENPGYTPLATGINALKIKMLGTAAPVTGMASAMNVIWPFNGVWGYAPTHVWLRYYLMLANDWPFWDKTSGSGAISRGKFPFTPSLHVPAGKSNSPIGKHARAGPIVAWSPTGYVPDGGNGGSPATGMNCWSMRDYWYAMGDTTAGVVDPAVYGPLAVNGYWPINSEDSYSADQWNAFGDDNFWISQRTLAGLMKKNTWHCMELRIKLNTLWTAASACPDPVYLGNIRRMPYRLPTDAKINDQLGNDTAISTHDRFIWYGNASGQRYVGNTTPQAPDTVVKRSDTEYGTPSMIGNKDGVYEAYVDGVLVHRRTDMRWRHIPTGIDCLWFDYGQTQLNSASVGSVYITQAIAVDGDIVTGPIGPMRTS